jgi:type I restriction enzyme S subunit
MKRILTKIDDLIDEISMGPFGSDIKVDSFVDFGIPVLNGSNVSGVKLKKRRSHSRKPMLSEVIS